MASPRYEVVQVEKQNPHATMGLKLTVLVISNTPDEVIEANIKANSKKYSRWLESVPAHGDVAVMIGGGPSVADHIEDIRNLVANGATVFASNGASKWARGNGVFADYQVIVDAKEETSTLVDHGAGGHLFASQCNRATLEAATNLTLIHLFTLDIEKLFPKERVDKGGYCLLGAGSTAGNAALAAAYSLGFRELHIFGYDSSYRSGESHAYSQPMNIGMPTTDMTWGGKTFQTSLGMKAQAEKFGRFAKSLKDGGCELYVYGEGLLQTIYNTKPEDLTEREKYQLMWQTETYRRVSPGENIVDLFLDKFKPEGIVIDFGCGTGRAALRMNERGLNVMLIDIADNCRDQEALMLPFLRHDLIKPLGINAEHGFCTDVMEHIPQRNVGTVVRNIMAAAKNVFFQISTIDDIGGKAIGTPLHLSVYSHEKWVDILSECGVVQWSQDLNSASLFYVTRREI